MKTLLLVLLTVPLWAANYACTSTGTGAGNFTDPNIWTGCNSTYPHNNGSDLYTVTIGTARTVTLGGSVSVGTGDVAGTAAVTVSSSGGSLVWSGVTPVTLTVSGDLVNAVTGASYTNAWATMQGGGSLVLDGTAAARTIGPSGNSAYRKFVANCTALAPCSITSTGTSGYFSARSFTYFGGLQLLHVNLSNLGDATHPWATMESNAAYTPADIENCTISNSGRLKLPGNLGGAVSYSYINNVRLDNTLDSGNYDVEGYPYGQSSGTIPITGNVFRGQLGTTGGNCQACTIDNNAFVSYVAGYIPIGFSESNPTVGRAMTEVKGNFVYKNQSSQGGLAPLSPLVDSNLVVGGPANININCINEGSNGLINTTVSNNVCASLSTNVTGDCFGGEASTGAILVLFDGNLSEIGVANTGFCDLHTLLGGTSQAITFTVRHGFSATNVYGIVDAETSLHTLHGLTMQGNVGLAWNGATNYKLYDTTSLCSTPSGYAIDYCSLTACGGGPCCDYNVGVATTATLVGCNLGYPNQYNGYVGQFTAPNGPGTHDVNLSVAAYNAVDLTRTFATFASAYLGHTATAGAWSGSSVSYAIGDIVSDIQSIWQGKLVLYRALAAHTSSATLRPGTGATWQTGCAGGPCWEYASAYYLAAMIAAGVTVTDGAIGAVADWPAVAAVKWIQRGRLSSNPALWCSGYLGETAGPVAFCGKGKALLAAAQ